MSFIPSALHDLVIFITGLLYQQLSTILNLQAANEFWMSKDPLQWIWSY